MAVWTCKARIVEYASVSVEADTEEEAIFKFEKPIHWLDGSAEDGEMADWEIYSPFMKDDE